MDLEVYECFSNNDTMKYWFYSTGPKGRIKKIIIYTKFTDSPVIYNLAFGDEDIVSGQINDAVISNNQDMEIVLATVVHTIKDFCDHYGKHLIFATGSTKSRTRLYQICISKFIAEIKRDFDIYGILGNSMVLFEKNVNYTAFLVKRK